MAFRRRIFGTLDLARDNSLTVVGSKSACEALNPGVRSFGVVLVALTTAVVGGFLLRGGSSSGRQRLLLKNPANTFIIRPFC